jgi:hypothetical protein
MISRSRLAIRLGLFTACVVPMLACERVPLLAPSGSTLTLTSPTTALPINGTAPIGVQVIEPSGTPPHSGTHVTFTTTLGTLFPTEAETDSSGQAITQFRAGNASGTATITAISGGSSVPATGVVKILVGTAAVGRVSLNASPSQVPSNGGSSTISAQVYDVNGNPLSATQVSFGTTAGTLSSTLALTDGNGAAQVVLTTSVQAVVTASVGATAVSGGGSGSGSGSGSGTGNGGGTTTTTPTTTPTGTASASVTVGVAGVATLVITAPTTPPSAGLPAVFTFVITQATNNPTPVKDVTVDWGDGSVPQSLGAITGTSTQSHVYTRGASYTIKATLVDVFGNTSTVSTSVAVVVTATTTIIVTPPTVPNPATVPFTASFTIQVTPPTGVGIQAARINWGDGAVQDLGGLIGTQVLQHIYNTKGTFSVVLTVTDTLDRTTSGSNSITIP